MKFESQLARSKLPIKIPTLRYKIAKWRANEQTVWTGIFFVKESYSSLLHLAARSKPGASGTEFPEIWTETTLVDFLPG